MVGKYLNEAPDRYTAYEDWAREIVRAKVGHRLAGVEKTLRTGNSRERLETLKVAVTERLTLLMDETFADAFRRFAPATRRSGCSRRERGTWVCSAWTMRVGP